MRRTSIVAALLFLGASAQGSATLAPQGPRFRVTSNLPGSEARPDIATAPSGEFVIVWTRGFGSIFGRRFDSLGNPIGEDFLVNTFTQGNRSRPRVAMDGSGGFLVVWQGHGEAGGGILAQRFGPSGVRLGPELAVSDPNAGAATIPDVGADESGDFVVTWQNLRYSSPAAGTIRARRFEAATESFAPEFIVSTETAFSYYHKPSVDMDDAGRFVVVWSRHASSNYGYGLIYGRRFDAAAQPSGGEFLVSPRDPDYSWQNYESRVDMNPMGEFVVVWQRQGDGVPEKLLARSFDEDGVPRTGEVLLDYGSGPGGLRWGPNVSLAGDGSFVAAWNNPGLRAQRFSGSSGVKIGGEVQVDPTTPPFLTVPAIDTHLSGSLVTAWTTSAGELFARQFLSPCAPPGVPGVNLELVNDGADLHMTWSDVIQATEYLIFEDTLPGGSFATQAGAAASGSSGLTIPAGAGDRFYLVAANGSCGPGPLR